MHVAIYSFSEIIWFILPHIHFLNLFNAFGHALAFIRWPFCWCFLLQEYIMLYNVCQVQYLPVWANCVPVGSEELLLFASMTKIQVLQFTNSAYQLVSLSKMLSFEMDKFVIKSELESSRSMHPCLRCECRHGSVAEYQNSKKQILAADVAGVLLLHPNGSLYGVEDNISCQPMAAAICLTHCTARGLIQFRLESVLRAIRYGEWTRQLRVHPRLHMSAVQQLGPHWPQRLVHPNGSLSSEHLASWAARLAADSCLTQQQEVSSDLDSSQRSGQTHSGLEQLLSQSPPRQYSSDSGFV